MKSVLLTLLLLCLIASSGWSQLPTKQVNGNGKEVINGAAGTVFNSGLTALTTTPTALTTSTLKVQTIHCKSNNSTATTVTIKDGSDTIYYEAVSLAANSVFIAQYGSVGITFSGGIKVSAGANTTVSCQVEGVLQ
jgi:hypothetical protein